jgi:hypothetical protein
MFFGLLALLAFDNTGDKAISTKCANVLCACAAAAFIYWMVLNRSAPGTVSAHIAGSGRGVGVSSLRRRPDERDRAQRLEHVASEIG